MNRFYVSLYKLSPKVNADKAVFSFFGGWLLWKRK